MSVCAYIYLVIAPLLSVSKEHLRFICFSSSIPSMAYYTDDLSVAIYLLLVRIEAVTTAKAKTRARISVRHTVARGITDI
jgi:hypothetical protein